MNETEFVKEIASKEEAFSQWYIDVVKKADLADYTVVKGCMVIKPYGYALWENMQHCLDQRIKATGHKNAYFPIFIPESLLKKEAEHVAGFAPEVAWVTQGGNQKLEERLAVRPTSEAIIGSLYSKWIHSWRDLPILINQWANIVRWEKVTRPFLRTTEFLWQEGHTAHQTQEEAEEETLKILAIYKDYIERDLAIPVIIGKKSNTEKFAGAMHTYTLEALMGDGKILQTGTSHNLGQNFAKAFDIRFLDENQEEQFAWTTSWGTSTRLVGGIIMVHGDERGLKLPPKVAPLHIVIVPIFFDQSKQEVLNKAQQYKILLSEKFNVELDDRDNYTPGWKFNEWEMKGVPVRLEIGPRDLAHNQVIAVRRDKGNKVIIPENELVSTMERWMTEIQNNLYMQAKSRLEENIRFCENYDQFKEIMAEKRGFIKAYWCGNEKCEEEIKRDTKATIRCIPLDENREKGKCIFCGAESSSLVYFGRAY
ncbi:MAG: proline--tRNA ligase [Candidatus Atribacteria bacterium]|nr:proline--tRNA ligase [Candidatus Atribacteria bacterium]